MIDDRLIVLEFDGRNCAAIVPSGNLLDLDFYLSGSEAAWRDAITPQGGGGSSRTLASLVASGDIEIKSESDGGEQLGQAALGILQAFFDQAKGVELA